ncbi:helix-turn-helix domain-containing protein [Actinokineospora pegani]|uniref:helix-turn-helix domain-containing protein n=1 Tax=Actinokineospora pegani TaxID=2654637 RepID=UPI0012EAE120|nr:helix-turn-helix domain-containing protein [Actinokineospora pegani]
MGRAHRRTGFATARKAAGHTRESLAAALGVDRTTVSTWESGEAIRRSREEWLRMRSPEGVRGRELSELAAWLYPEEVRAPGGHVLAGPGWLWDEPVPLDEVRLRWVEAAQPGALEVEHLVPLTDLGVPYRGYSRAVRDVVRPRLMENRPSYRLTEVGPGASFGFGMTAFFSVFDVKQAVAHEFKAAWAAGGREAPGWDELPVRRSIGMPFDPAALLMSPGISTLTIRRGRRGEHTFVLHERDSAKVADGGGLAHVLPAGEFQPATADPRADLSLWNTIMREFSEEFLGDPEHDGVDPVDYTRPPFTRFEAAKRRGRFRVSHYGLVMEPLELGAGQLTVAVVDGDTFDVLFADRVAVNDEGAVGRDVPFTDEAVRRLEPRLSGSALTLLRLALRDRRSLV